MALVNVDIVMQGTCSGSLKLKLLGSHRHSVVGKKSVGISAATTVYLKLHLLFSLFDILKKVKKERRKQARLLSCGKLKEQFTLPACEDGWCVFSLEEGKGQTKKTKEPDTVGPPLSFTHPL